MHTKISLNVRHRVVGPAGIAARTAVSRNQAQTIAREQLTRQPPTLDSGSTGSSPISYSSSLWKGHGRVQTESVTVVLREKSAAGFRTRLHLYP